MSSSKPKIAVRYCGGCNPKYDRVALAKRLAAIMPECDFVGAESGVRYAAVVIMHGCLSRCTSTDDLSVSESQIVGMNSWEDLLPVKKKLEGIVETQRMLEEKDYMSLTHEQVLEVLPHRAPMLFVDTVTELVPGVTALAHLHVDPAWDIFRGHFPDDPVFPGALTTEAVAQAADVLVLTKELYKGKTPLFMSIDRANFLRKILPGADLDIKVTVFKEIEERGVVSCKGQVLMNGELAATAQVTIALR